MKSTPLPLPTRCPTCGHSDRTTICKYCGTDKTVKRKPSDQENIFQRFLAGLPIKRKEKA